MSDQLPVTDSTRDPEAPEPDRRAQDLAEAMVERYPFALIDVLAWVIEAPDDGRTVATGQALITLHEEGAEALSSAALLVVLLSCSNEPSNLARHELVRRMQATPPWKHHLANMLPRAKAAIDEEDQADLDEADIERRMR